MSSYVTSPFVLEERRLQGIVNRCSEELDLALQKVIEQQNSMKQREEEQKQKDRAYFEAQSGTDQAHIRTLQREKAELEEKKRQLRDMLRTIQLEFQVFQNNHFDLEAIMERHEQLSFWLENSEGNLEELERHILAHVQKAEKKVREQSAKENGRARYSVEHAVKKLGNKGVSLQMNVQSDSMEEQVSPLDKYETKMEMAMRSPYQDRFPSLHQLKKEFDLQPEYAKAAFAVNHMRKLDEIIRQLEEIVNSEKAADKKREEAILRYRAICSLMQEEVEESFIADERSTRKLIQISNELYKKYQEIQKHEYVSAAIANVMERHGISYQDSKNAAYGSIMRFSMEHASVDISGTENNHLIMEVSGEYRGEAPTLDERRKSVSSARHLCSLLKTIEIELKEDYGIVFGSVLAEQPSEESIEMKCVTSKSGDKKYRDEKKRTFDMM